MLERNGFQINFWICNKTLFAKLSKTCADGDIVLHMTVIVVKHSFQISAFSRKLLLDQNEIV